MNEVSANLGGAACTLGAPEGGGHSLVQVHVQIQICQASGEGVGREAAFPEGGKHSVI